MHYIAVHCTSLWRKCHLIQYNPWNVCNSVGKNNCDTISPRWPIFSLVSRKYVFEHPAQVDRLVKTNMFAVFLPALKQRPHFPKSVIDPVALLAACWEFHLSSVLNRVHQSSQLSLVSAPPGFPPGKANGPCAAYTSPNYKDAQRVAFVANKPPLLNYLNVPLWSRSGPAHPVPTALWLDGSTESHVVIGYLPWASTW